MTWLLKSGCLLIFLLLLGCGSKRKDTASPESRTVNPEFPSQEGWKSSITLTKAGKLQAVIRYGHMAQYESRRIALFDQGVKVDFYDENGKHTSRLSSERGEYNLDSENVAGEGHVVVVSDTGITMQTERLRWNRQTEKIVSDDPVTVIHRQGDVLYGLGFESNADLSRWVIKQPRGQAKKGVDLNVFESPAAQKDTASASKDSLETRRSGG